MRSLRNFCQLPDTLSPPWHQARFRGLLLLLCCVFAAFPVIARQPVAPDQAQFYVNEYAKLLSTMQESSFTYTGRSSFFTPVEGLRAKSNSKGTLSISASRKSLHTTRGGTVTWSNQAVKVPQDQGNIEVLVTSKNIITVCGSDRNSGADDVMLGVQIKQQVGADGWSQELLGQELGFFLGYLGRGAPQDKVASEQNSLLALCRTQKVEAVPARDAKSNDTIGFIANADDLQMRVLFDPNHHHQLRSIELTRPADKIRPFALVRATLNMIEMRQQNQLPAYFKFKVTTEHAGGSIPRSEFPENAVLTEIQKKSENVKYESSIYESEYELTNIVYQEAPQSPWFVLDGVIPNGTIVQVTENEAGNYFWQDGQVKMGFPPKSETEIREAIQAAFERPDPAVKRYQTVQSELSLSHQHCVVVFADPQRPLTKSLYQTYFANDDYQDVLGDFRTVAVSTSASNLLLAQDLAKSVSVDLAQSAAPLLVITDENGKVLGQLQDQDFSSNDGQSVDPKKVDAFLKRHAPTKLDARILLAEALDQARRENKRVLLQQTAPWCYPCALLSQFLDKQRNVWEKDYVWIKIDSRWTNSEEVMRPIRKDDSGGIPWIAILDATGKTMVTSNLSSGETIGFPSHDEPAGIEHFIHMLRSTAQRMTEKDLQTLKNVLQTK